MSDNDYVFGKETSFEKAYPELEDAIVEYMQYKSLFPSAKDTSLPQRFSLKSDGGRIPCDNPTCVNGGFWIDAVASTNDNNEIRDTRCPGHENVGRGSRSCLSRLRYRVRLVPKAK
jgi:hypothetical protein